MDICGPGQTANKHRRGSACRLHPAVGSGRTDSACAYDLRITEDGEPEPFVAGPSRALCPTQLWIRGGETSRQTAGADQEKGELHGEFLKASGEATGKERCK